MCVPEWACVLFFLPCVAGPPAPPAFPTRRSSDLASPPSTVAGVAKSKIVSPGVTALDDDAALVPTALVAVTANVYAVPFVRPLTVADDADGSATRTAVCAMEPTYGVTV